MIVVVFLALLLFLIIKVKLYRKTWRVNNVPNWRNSSRLHLNNFNFAIFLFITLLSFILFLHPILFLLFFSFYSYSSCCLSFLSSYNSTVLKKTFLDSQVYMLLRYKSYLILYQSYFVRMRFRATKLFSISLVN